MKERYELSIDPIENPTDQIHLFKDNDGNWKINNHKAITKAFRCVPNAQDLPSVSNEAEENQKAVMKKFEDFLGELQ